MEESTEKEKLEGVPRVLDYINLDKVLVSDKPIMTAKEAIGFVFEKIYGTKEEIAVAIFCDDNLVPLCVATADKKKMPHNRMFSPEEIKQTAQFYNASYVTLLYSCLGLSSEGEKCFSSGDGIAMTKAIADACNKVDVKVYDSIVVSSFRERPFAEPEPVYHSIMAKEDF